MLKAIYIYCSFFSLQTKLSHPIYQANRFIEKFCTSLPKIQCGLLWVEGGGKNIAPHKRRDIHCYDVNWYRGEIA